MSSLLLQIVIDAPQDCRTVHRSAVAEGDAVAQFQCPHRVVAVGRQRLSQVGNILARRRIEAHEKVVDGCHFATTGSAAVLTVSRIETADPVVGGKRHGATRSRLSPLFWSPTTPTVTSDASVVVPWLLPAHPVTTSVADARTTIQIRARTRYERFIATHFHSSRIRRSLDRTPDIFGSEF